MFKKAYIFSLILIFITITGCGGGGGSSSDSTSPSSSDSMPSPPQPTQSTPAPPQPTQSTPSTSYPLPDKYCALTFDDGPDNTQTAKVLEKLEKHGIKVTFMWVGENITDYNKEVIDRIVIQGHEIGNHSWSYDDMSLMTSAQITESITKTTNAIRQYTGQEPKFFRAPYLNVSDTLYETVPYPFISAGAISKDWSALLGGAATAQERADNVINSMEDGTIILMHDIQSDPNNSTPEALDIIIPNLLAKGYAFVTVSELFKQKGITPQAGQKTQWTVVKPPISATDVPRQHPPGFKT